jgi:hypothetical protein
MPCYRDSITGCPEDFRGFSEALEAIAGTVHLDYATNASFQFLSNLSLFQELVQLLTASLSNPRNELQIDSGYAQVQNEHTLQV